MWTWLIAVFSWVQLQLIEPVVRWWEEVVLGSWEEWLLALVRQGFEETTRFLNALGSWFLSLFSQRSYREQLRRTWQENSWQQWWGEVATRPSTLNALVANLVAQQQHQQQQRRSPQSSVRTGQPTTAEGSPPPSAPSDPGSSAPEARAGHFNGTCASASANGAAAPEVAAAFALAGAAATAAAHTVAPAGRSAGSSSSRSRGVTWWPTKPEPHKGEPPATGSEPADRPRSSSRRRGGAAPSMRVVRPVVFVQQSGMGILDELAKRRHGLIEDTKMAAQLAVSRAFELARRTLRAVLFLPSREALAQQHPYLGFTRPSRGVGTGPGQGQGAAAAAVEEDGEAEAAAGSAEAGAAGGGGSSGSRWRQEGPPSAGSTSSRGSHKAHLPRSKSAHVNIAELATNPGAGARPAPASMARRGLRRSRSYGRLHSGAPPPTETLSDVLSVIRAAGYPAELHSVTTQDGYVLQLERIPRPGARDTVFFMHGVLDTSMAWVSGGVTGSQAFAAWEAGFDVWLGNSRGNAPRQHQDPARRGRLYWRYNTNHMGMYDISAQLDHIHNTKCAELGAGTVTLDLDHLGPLAGSFLGGAGAAAGGVSAGGRLPDRFASSSSTCAAPQGPEGAGVVQGVARTGPVRMRHSNSDGNLFRWGSGGSAGSRSGNWAAAAAGGGGGVAAGGGEGGAAPAASPAAPAPQNAPNTSAGVEAPTRPLLPPIPDALLSEYGDDILPEGPELVAAAAAASLRHPHPHPDASVSAASLGRTGSSSVPEGPPSGSTTSSAISCDGGGNGGSSSRGVSEDPGHSGAPAAVALAVAAAREWPQALSAGRASAARRRRELLEKEDDEEEEEEDKQEGVPGMPGGRLVGRTASCGAELPGGDDRDHRGGCCGSGAPRAGKAHAGPSLPSSPTPPHGPSRSAATAAATAGQPLSPGALPRCPTPPPVVQRNAVTLNVLSRLSPQPCLGGPSAVEAADPAAAPPPLPTTFTLEAKTRTDFTPTLAATPTPALPAATTTTTTVAPVLTSTSTPGSERSSVLDAVGSVLGPAADAARAAVASAAATAGAALATAAVSASQLLQLPSPRRSAGTAAAGGGRGGPQPASSSSPFLAPHQHQPSLAATNSSGALFRRTHSTNQLPTHGGSGSNSHLSLAAFAPAAAAAAAAGLAASPELLQPFPGSTSGGGRSGTLPLPIRSPHLPPHMASEPPPGWGAFAASAAGPGRNVATATSAAAPGRGVATVSTSPGAPAAPVVPYKLRCVAHSLGGMSVLIHLVTRLREGRPHHMSRLLLLTPAGFHKHSPKAAKPVMWLLPPLTWLLRTFLGRSFSFPLYIPTPLARGVTFQLLLSAYRIPGLGELLRTTYRALLDGDVSQWDRAMQLPHYSAQDMPAISVDQVLHLIQLTSSDAFTLYDYGSPAANTAHYGTPTPPDIAAEYWRLDLPVHLVAGSRDGVIPPPNIRRHLEAMRAQGVAVSYREFDFGHLDFTFGVKEELRMYLMRVLKM